MTKLTPEKVAAPERIWTVNESPADEICWRDNVFFTDKDASAVGWDVGKLVEYTRADLADRIEELEAKLAKAVEALGFYATLIGEKHECPWHMLSDDFGEKARAALAELGDRDMCKNFTELREGEG